MWNKAIWEMFVELNLSLLPVAYVWQNLSIFTHTKNSKFKIAFSIIQLIEFNILAQGSYRQVCVKFKHFSKTPKRLSYYIQGLKTYEKY